MLFSGSYSKKLILSFLLIVSILMAGCGNKAGTPPADKPAAQQSTAKPGPAAGGKSLTAKEAVALAEANAKKALGNEADVVKVYGNQKGTTVDGRAADWQITFANPERKSLVVDINNGQIAQERSGGADDPLKEAAGGKWIDSVKAAEVAQASGGTSFKHTVANPSVNYTLGRLSEIAWYGDKKAGVINESDRRPAWRVSYDNDEHYYVDALGGAFITKGSYQNRP